MANWLGVALLGWLALIPFGALASTETAWIRISGSERTLEVLLGDTVIHRLHPISIGAGGPPGPRLKGDRTTPSGTFKIDWINPHSRFHTFYRFNYPTPVDAWQAYLDGVFTQQDYANYWLYRERHGRPPQNTRLGGQIGIHGLGHRDPHTHELVNWTDGCVAVTNEQLDTLARWLKIGTRIVVAP